MKNIEFQQTKLPYLFTDNQNKYWLEYNAKVMRLEIQGMSTSDAQSVVDCEDYQP